MDDPSRSPAFYRYHATKVGVPSSTGRTGAPSARASAPCTVREPVRPPAKSRTAPRGTPLLLLPLLLLLALASCAGCGNGTSPGEGDGGEPVRSALRDLSSRTRLSYRTRLETRVGVYGYTAQGEERGEGLLDGEDFRVKTTRVSPEGEETYTLSSREGGFFLERDGVERPAVGSEMPGTLQRPRVFLELFSRFIQVGEEGRETYQGRECLAFRLEYDPSLAFDVLPGQAREYFSNLDYRLQGRAWLDEASLFPVALTLELTGLDRVEKITRLQLVFTFQPLEGEG